jgi:flagellar motor component MotA
MSDKSIIYLYCKNYFRIKGVVMNYFCSIIVTVLAVSVSFIVAGGRNPFRVFFDAPSLILIIIFPIVFVSIIKGISNTKTAFLIKKNKNAS